jgi:hypothetical protein
VIREKPGLREMFEVVARTVPFFWGLTALAALAIVVDLVLLARALHRVGPPGAVEPDASIVRAPWSRARERLALAGVGAYLLAFTLVLVSSVGRLRSGFTVPTTTARVTALVDVLQGEANALPYGAMLGFVVVGLGAWAHAECWCARRKAAGETASRGSALAATFGVAGLGVLPLLVGIRDYGVSLIKTGAVVSGIDRALALMFLSRGILEAREGLDRWAAFAAGGVVLAILAVGANHLGAREPSDVDDRRGRRLALAGLGGALALFAASLPLRAENRAPWPAPSPSAVYNVGVFEPSSVAGPDPAPGAPVLSVERDGFLLDGSPRTARSLYETLVVLHNNYDLLHSGDAFPGELAIACPRDVPAAQLARALEVAHAAAYLRPSLVWTAPTPLERPLLGLVPRFGASAAAMALPPPRDEDERAGLDGHAADAPKPWGWLDVGKSRTCGAVADAVLAARRKNVFVGVRMRPTGPPDVNEAR